MFDESFREDVQEIDKHREAMIWRVVSRYAELSGTEPAASAMIAYSMVDGVFQAGLRYELSGKDDEVAQLERELPRVFTSLLTGP